ncbi:questin oxidase family protein [Actinoplanes sp. NPDC024001]|uniref:questin oxidase family protein n=1 Tax=Actinoplanes sp. NPDC024001 TaxID=3154598 RepID=UPI0033ED97F2
MTLDEALHRLRDTGPERAGWLSNHAPMAVEAMVRHGRADRVHRWIDTYRDQLEDAPRGIARITPDEWRDPLGDPTRTGDWLAFFDRKLRTAPWRDVLAIWWPRLLPGIAAGATHGVIRVGHAVRALLDHETPERTAELAQGLGYWAARWQPLAPPGRGPYPAIDPRAALDAVPRIPDQRFGIRSRLAQLAELPTWPQTAGAVPAGNATTANPTAGAVPTADATTAIPTAGAVPTADATTADPTSGAVPAGNAAKASPTVGAANAKPAGAVAEARLAAAVAGTAPDRLRAIVAAAVVRYRSFGHGSPVMLVHAATAPAAVLRTLPALPSELAAPSLAAAWAAAAAVTAAYTPATPDPSAAEPADPSWTATNIFDEAMISGDAHAIKFADAAIEMWQAVPDPALLAAARHATRLIG